MPVRGDARVAGGFGERPSTLVGGTRNAVRWRLLRDGHVISRSLPGMQAGRCTARRSSEPCDRGAPRQTKRGRGASRARLHSRCEIRSGPSGAYCGSRMVTWDDQTLAGREDASAWKKAPTISRGRACSEDTGRWACGLGGE
ncbi:hypothetical protein L1887_55960 [Cichorium endivia]|nr:hypothetical protein L1887_55960 [Cichorium endivia]